MKLSGNMAFDTLDGRRLTLGIFPSDVPFITGEYFDDFIRLVHRKISNELNTGADNFNRIHKDLKDMFNSAYFIPISRRKDLITLISFRIIDMLSNKERKKIPKDSFSECETIVNRQKRMEPAKTFKPSRQIEQEILNGIKEKVNMEPWR